MSSPVLPRLPLVNLADLSGDAAENFRRIAGNRGGMPISFQTFFNSPLGADAVARFGEQVRFNNDLPQDVLEVVVMRVAAQRHDDFMWAHHLGLAGDAGLSAEELQAIYATAPAALARPDRSLAAALTDAVLSDSVTDELCAEGAARFGNAMLFDLVLVVVYYELIHRLFSTFRIVGDRDTRKPLSTDEGVIRD